MNEKDSAARENKAGPEVYRHLVGRLPVTMRPTLNQQLSQWETLFPFEQNSAATFMKGVETFSPSAWRALTAPLSTLETRMGVKSWNFSETHDTLENATDLARSEYYAAWRREVERVFDAVNAAAADSSAVDDGRVRLILLVLPGNLPVDPQSVWKQWDPRGHEIKISGKPERFCELAMQGEPGMPGIGALAAQRDGGESSDLWFIDAETKLNALLSSQSHFAACSLNYPALKPFRDRFLAELNKAPKDTRITDEIMARLRLASWDGWGLWPAELANRPRLRRFIIDLFLSGNGALIFSNAFVEWAACEALRRARPRTIVARFGVRSKPKPFTSIAIFENQQRVSSLPDVDDPENSAIDAVILARYVWLTASRYPQQERTLCLCIAEHADSAYVILPAGKSLGWSQERPITPEELYSWLRAQFLSE